MRKGKHNSNPGEGAGGRKSAAALELAPAPGPAPDPEPLSEFGARKVVLFPPQLVGNPARVHLDSLSESASRSTLDRLSKFAEMFGHTVDSFPWVGLTPGHVLACRGLMRETGARASTINQMLSHLRSVARTCRRLRLEGMSAETCAAICEIEGVKGSSPPAGRALPQGEVEALLGACAADRTGTGARDLALVSLLYYTGLRRDEACRLDPGDYHARDHRLRVFGKGEKEEYVYVESRPARLALGRWLKMRGRVGGALFCSVWRGGRVRVDPEGRARQLSGDAVYKIVERRAGQAGLQPCSPHDLRRSAITHLLERGEDALKVQAFARHEQLSTTTRYDRRGEQGKREAARRLAALRVMPAPVRPRPKRAPRHGKKGRGGRPRMGLLEGRPRDELVALARAHQCHFGERATRAELARLIREAVEDGGRGIEG